MASQLWVSGESVDDACDPLFKLWREAGGLDDDLVWKRATLAFASRERGLLRYVSSLGSASARTDLAALQRVFTQPQRTVTAAASVSPQRRGAVLSLGLQRYARYDPEGALKQWQALAPGHRAGIARLRSRKNDLLHL